MAQTARAATDDALTVVWEPQSGPQTALIRCPLFEVFFGGARGGGKTDGMLGDWLSHSDLYGENAIGLMLRRERTQLVEAIERSKAIFTPLGAKFHEQDKLWRFPNGARLRFAYLDRDADAEAYQGHSYTRVYVEELTNFPTPGPVLKLMATLRSGAGVPCGFRATGNPGGPGHQWVRERYIEPCPTGWKIIAEEFENPWSGEVVVRERVFIPSKLQDNRYLGPEYVANLQMTGSAELVRAWLEGDWDAIEGAFFDGWRPAIHVVRPFEVPAHWLRFRAFDWGYAAPFSVGWWAVSDGDVLGDGRQYPRGCLVRYREWYGAEKANVGQRMDAEQVAEGILERERRAEEHHKPNGGGRTIQYGVADPSIFRQDGGPSIAERMIRAGVRWRPADNARIARAGALGGWDQMRARLRGAEDGPMIVCFETCTDSIRTIPLLQHDPDRPEDLDTEQEDHAADEWRYACMSRPYVRKALETVKPRFPIDRTFDEMRKAVTKRRREMA